MDAGAQTARPAGRRSDIMAVVKLETMAATPMTKHEWHEREKRTVRAPALRSAVLVIASPIARWLQRAGMGAFIIWVSSDNAAGVNGLLLGVDAGM